jgi:hypothetical protein
VLFGPGVMDVTKAYAAKAMRISNVMPSLPW